jgi:hypothetical protein
MPAHELRGDFKLPNVIFRPSAMFAQALDYVINTTVPPPVTYVKSVRLEWCEAKTP